MPLGPYAELEFDLAGALRDRLIEMFAAMPTAPLSRELVGSEIPNEQGVYQIYLGDEIVYIGKTDADAGLKARLNRHSDKIQHRVGLNPNLVSFKAIRLFVFTVMDLETELLRTHRPPWNGRGFGSNDPGRERDTTRIKPYNFDALFPVDIEREVDFGFAREERVSAEQAISRVQSRIPWKLRRQNAGGGSRQCHPDLASLTIELSGKSVTALAMMREIVSQLPPGWQATMLKSHAILYREKKDYPEPLAVVVSPGAE